MIEDVKRALQLLESPKQHQYSHQLFFQYFPLIFVISPSVPWHSLHCTLLLCMFSDDEIDFFNSQLMVLLQIMLVMIRSLSPDIASSTAHHWLSFYWMGHYVGAIAPSLSHLDTFSPPESWTDDRVNPLASIRHACDCHVDWHVDRKTNLPRVYPPCKFSILRGKRKRPVRSGRSLRPAWMNGRFVEDLLNPTASKFRIVGGTHRPLFNLPLSRTCLSYDQDVRSTLSVIADNSSICDWSGLTRFVDLSQNVNKRS